MLKRFKKPQTPPFVPASPDAILPQPIHAQPTGLEVKKKLSTKKILLIIAGAFVALIILIVVACLAVYQHELGPVGTNKNQYVKVTIVSGMNPDDIGRLLQDDGVIQSSFAFTIYTRLSGTRGDLQAGTYKLSPSDSTSAIVNHLIQGSVDTFSITFLPGATLAEDEQVLVDAGFSQTDIDNAATQSYTGAVFQDKPASADLEGYIYGDTYKFNAGATVPEVLQRAFDEFSTVVTDNNLVAEYASHGLNLYQGITLASIIQREVSNQGDQKQVAQVFYLRLSTNMVLGSDVTYQYAAKKLGVTPDPTLDSPYNTRINTGLPPGPIATPGESALLAVGDPAPGDYLYFLSGDDGTTYFAHTYDEHQTNITNYCKIKCSGT